MTMSFAALVVVSLSLLAPSRGAPAEPASTLDCLASGAGQACGEEQIEQAEDFLTESMRIELLQARLRVTSKAAIESGQPRENMMLLSDVESTGAEVPREQDFRIGPSCAAYCQYEPSNAWFTQTACCGCGNQTCPACKCGAECAYQPSVAWPTQTDCCGCKASSLQQQDNNTAVAVLQEAAASVAKQLAFQTGPSCAAYCQFEPKNAWFTQTACCGCGNQTCPACKCGAECSYQPSVAWPTQTDCCGCKASSLQQQDNHTVWAVLQETAASVAKQPAFQTGPSCAAYCQFEPKNAWFTQTACCGCGNQTCPACKCGAECSYQPSIAWPTQTDCCGCKSAILEQQLLSPAASEGFKTGQSCAAYCQFEPKNAWFTQTACCGCGNQTCPACKCGAECAYQPSVAWPTQTDCCGCKASSLQQQDQVKLLAASEEAVAVAKQPAFQTGPSCAAYCQFEPKNAWFTQTACCGCGNQTCPACKCGAECAYQPSVAWPTQTDCCGCKASSLQQQDNNTVLAVLQETAASVAKQPAFQTGPSCAAYCQFEPKNAWFTQTACCGCGNQTCPACKCGAECSYQPWIAWPTQTDCCGCKA